MHICAVAMECHFHETHINNIVISPPLSQGILPLTFSRIAPPVGPLHAAVAFVPMERAPPPPAPGAPPPPQLLGSEGMDSGTRRGTASLRIQIIGEGLGMASRIRATACTDGAEHPNAPPCTRHRRRSAGPPPPRVSPE